jgi:HK97 family phage prohead protease
MNEKVIEINGYASVYCVDRHKDLIMPGAFEETLKKQRPLMFWMHNYKQIIGTWMHAEEDSYGLKVNGMIDISGANDFVNYIAEYLCNKALNLSIGFNVGDNAKKNDKGIREIYKVDLIEISIVPSGTGTNPKAVATANKIYKNPSRV